MGLSGCPSAGSGLARPVWSTGRPLWLGQLCAPEGGGGGGGGGGRGPRAPRPVPSRRSPTEGGDGEGGRPEGALLGAGAGRTPGRGAGPVATGVPGVSRGPRPPRRGQSRGSPPAAAPGSAEREGNRGGGGKSEAARSGGPFLLRASAAGLPWPSPPPFPVPQCRHRPRPAALRRALPSPPPFPLLSRARPRGMVGGGSPPGPRCAAGPALGVPWTPRPGSEGVRGSAAHPRERPVLRGPLRAVRANPGFLWSRSDSSSRSFRRDARSALAGLRGCYVILQQRNWLQQMHV